jgi:hypothetical protein
MNAICQRLAGTLRRELPGRVLIPGERHLHTVLAEHQTHDDTARPHQDIAQHLPGDEPGALRTTVTDLSAQQIRRKPVLDGLINEYARRPIMEDLQVTCTILFPSGTGST